MSNTLTRSYEEKKSDLISKMLDHGIFKFKNHQLYELSLTELENVYQKHLRNN
ncbi:Fur-regulated basic protein FbpA [Sporolactobacillus shoreicorticis]|uniref:Fur-regulated basic protein FbpA n=1 Tax=Sporolactobacillus shoreicorticis TaxID=1923877 RepID=A0ABW5S6E3_9BACL|nr:Fur-regulated basic protein FbpA [Sporolactobacillus shoreicorticis]MCO7126211.1 Fur-regulated basic protein FbpA [Sporolactobacillus shoreicorticis]